MKKAYIIVLIAMMFSACSTLQIGTDYDVTYDFTKNKTYAVVYNATKDDNTLINDRIEEAIQKNMNEKAYREVNKEQAELVFIFHVHVIQMSDIRTDYQTVGYGGFSYGGGWGYRGGGAMLIPHSTTYRWKEGQLIIDAYNPKTKKIIWRGTAKDEITGSNYTPQEKTIYINKVVSELLKAFPNSGV